MPYQPVRTWTAWLAMDGVKTLREDDLDLPRTLNITRLYTALSIYLFDPDNAVHVKVQCPETGAAMLVCGTPYQPNGFNLPRNSWLPLCMGPVVVIGADLTAPGLPVLTDIGRGSALFALEAAQQVSPMQITGQSVWIYGVDSTTPVESREAHLQSPESLTAQCRRWLQTNNNDDNNNALGRIQVKTPGLTPILILGRRVGTTNRETGLAPNPRAPGLAGAVAIMGGRFDTTTEPPTWELQEITQTEITQHLVYLQQHHQTDTTLQPMLHTE